MYIKIKADNFGVICRNIEEAIKILEKAENNTATKEDFARLVFDIYAAGTLLKLEKLGMMVAAETVETSEDRMIKKLAN